MQEQINILGGGESGVWAAVLAVQQGWSAFLSDGGSIKSAYKEILEQYGIPYEEGSHDLKKLSAAKITVKSPGVPKETEVVQFLEKNGTEIISEIEWGFRHTKVPVVAITGSNGKSTTTSLTGHIFQKAGKNVAVGGNLGDAFCKLIVTEPENLDYYILEISSFQLDDCKTFKPLTAAILNITPDHLDRYGENFEAYIAAKLKIAEQMDAADTLIINDDDEVLRSAVERSNFKTNIHRFGWDMKPNRSAYTENQQLIINIKKKMTMKISDMKIIGKHNVYNSMAAGISARVLDLRKDIIRESFMDYKGLEHRLEQVAKIGGIEFINDSKSTNVNSSWFALESVNKPIVWIAGGVDKGNDYTSLVSLVRSKVKAVICLGENNVKLHNAFSKNVDVMMNASSMYEAVQMANAIASGGDCVLLSPACASFDLFENYKERGNQFKEHVLNL